MVSYDEDPLAEAIPQFFVMSACFCFVCNCLMYRSGLFPGVPLRIEENPQQQTFRNNFVETNLRFCELKKQGDVAIGPTTATDKNEEKQTRTKQEIMLCTICLSEIVAGEEVAWSSNHDCSHIFHRACIRAWLLIQKECPMCRKVFLVDKQHKKYREDFMSETVEFLQ